MHREELSADDWEELKKLAENIGKKAEKKPALQETTTNAQNSPSDKDAYAALRLQLKKLLQEGPELRAEAVCLFSEAQATSATVVASGRRSMAIGGNASGNAMITPDHNKL